jgi:hypothetical protein
MMAVTVKVHKLWSRTGASPHAWNFGHTTFRFEPPSGFQPPIAQVFEDPNLSLAKLPDQQVLLAVVVDISPTWRGIAGALNPNRHVLALETHRSFEIRGAALASTVEQQER